MLKDILKQYGAEQLDDDTLCIHFKLKLAGSDFLEIIFFKSDEREIRFIHDNFPSQRRFFTTNIPYTSVEDFESDLLRMKIEIPAKLIEDNL